MIGLVATLVVAALHFVFMILETFLWTTKRGRKIFAQTEEQAQATKVLAANQGVYNGALSALLIWASMANQRPTMVALLVFVIFVGIYGAITAKPTILFLQALPGGIALALVLLGL